MTFWSRITVNLEGRLGKHFSAPEPSSGTAVSNRAHPLPAGHSTPSPTYFNWQPVSNQPDLPR